jgi:hypothetical protein
MLAAYKADAAKGSPATRPAAPELVRALGALRTRFAKLGRCEAILFDMRRRGEDREVLLHVLLSARVRAAS